MQHISSKHLVVPILAIFGALSLTPLRAQQTVPAYAISVPAAAEAPASAANITDTSDPTNGDLLISTSADHALPSPQTNVQEPQPQTNPHIDKQTQRILGLIPNFRAVSADVQLPPQSVKEKFVTASQDSFDYSSIFLPASIALASYERNSTPEFGQGGVGYARYLWHSAVDQTIENYMVEFVVPSIAHEDTRFYTLGHGGFTKRTSYALSRAIITRSDSGKKVFNSGEVIGAGVAAGISNLYYPSHERTLSNTGSQWALNVGIDAGTFVFKEFWPDINHRLFHGAKPFNATAPSTPSGPSQ